LEREKPPGKLEGILDTCQIYFNYTAFLDFWWEMRMIMNWDYNKFVMLLFLMKSLWTRPSLWNWGSKRWSSATRSILSGLLTNLMLGLRMKAALLPTT
jgi:hypothetical protein